MSLGQIRHRLTGSEDKGQPLEPPFCEEFLGKAVTAGEGSLQTIEGCIRICRFCEGGEESVNLILADRFQNTAKIPESPIQRGHRQFGQTTPITADRFAISR